MIKSIGTDRFCWYENDVFFLDTLFRFFCRWKMQRILDGFIWFALFYYANPRKIPWHL